MNTSKSQSISYERNAGLCWGNCMAVGLILLAPLSALSASEISPRLNECYGVEKRLVISGQKPFVEASVDSADGHFLVDFGSVRTSIDPKKFDNDIIPRPLEGTSDVFGTFDFFGPFSPVRLQVRSIPQDDKSIRQAGVIGTDFLSLTVFTLDYERGAIYRSFPSAFCGDDVLRADGFVPLSAKGHYVNSSLRVKSGFPKAPMVPVRIGGVEGLALLDTGFRGARDQDSVNINPAMYDTLLKAGVELSAGEPVISTACAGTPEKRETFRLNQPLKLVTMDSAEISLSSNVQLILQRPTEGLKLCGSIATIPEPIATLSGAFFLRMKRISFDPYSSRIWVPALKSD